MWLVLSLFGLMSLSGSLASVKDQMAETTQLCCNRGTEYGRNHSSEDCSSSIPPVVPPAFGSLCIFAMDQCCKEYFLKKRDCDTGIERAMSVQACAGTVDSAKACCTKCLEGKVEGSDKGVAVCKAAAVNGDAGAEDLLAGDAYELCCIRASKEHKKVEREPTPPASHHNSTPISVYRSAGENTIASQCEEYAPNELCAHHCIPVPGSYKCQCNPGFRLMSDGRNCIEVTKNRCKPRNPCQHKCNDNGVEIKCSCRRGYQLKTDGKSCEDIDECTLETPVCLPDTQCYNIQGSYKCIPKKNKPGPKEKGQCPPGFIRNDRNNVCDDINECTQPNPPCPSYLCQNTVGGYKCGGVLGDPANLMPSAAKPGADDRCPQGFRAGFNEECEDVDECALHKDDCNPLSQFCINTRGSFYCQNKVSKHCPPGFKIDPTTNKCEDINECEDGQDICKPDQVCVNEPGEYDCKPREENRQRFNIKCPEGMRMKPGTTTCEDIDECAEGTHICDLHQSCLNTNGSHECRCKLGFEIDRVTGSCMDVNECATDTHNCIPGSQRCDNTVGSFICVRFTSCGTGYILQAATGQCEDIDECALGTHNCEYAGPDWHCENHPGIFRCVRDRPPTTPDYEYDYYSSEEVEDDNKTKTEKTTPKVEATATTTTTPTPTKPSITPTPGPIPLLVDRREEELHPSQIDLRVTEPNPVTQQRDLLKHDHVEPRTFEQTQQATSSNHRSQLEQESHKPDYQRPETHQPEYSAQTEQTEQATSPNNRSQLEQESQKPNYQQPKAHQPEYSVQTEQIVQATIPNNKSQLELESQKPNYNPEYSAQTEQPQQITSPNYGSQPEPKLQDPEYQQPETHKPDYPAQSSTNYYKVLPIENGISPKPTDNVEPIPPKVVEVNVGIETATVRGVKKEDGSVVIDTENVPENKWTKVVEQPVNFEQPGCNLGYYMNEQAECIDIDECATNRHSCSGLTETCRNTVGGYVCDCDTGFRRDLKTGVCVAIDAPVPTKFFWGYQDYRPITPRPFKTRSMCDVGYHLNSQTKKCEDINECLNGQANCAAVEICVNTEGGYRCECPPKWKLDEVRHRCVPEKASGFPAGYGNEPGYQAPNLSDVQNTFKQHQYVDPAVTKLDDNRSIITCPAGYKLGYDNACEDINECATGQASCGSMQCTNLPGGYICSCPQGHKLVDGNQCEDVDECALGGNMPVCSQNADCLNTVGSYQCKCHHGFRSAPVNDKVCVDVDECTENLYGTLCPHRCNNLWGGYRCSCFRGYRLNIDNRTCVDIDECTDHKQKILCVGRCVNEPGSYRCTCPQGYRLSEDKRSCIDIDECETGIAPCAKGGAYGGTSDVCFNTRGGYRCLKVICPAGYRLESRHRCTLIEKICPPADWDCAHQPTTISYNFITFVSKLYIPESKVELFTMRGPSWSNGIMRFNLKLVNVDAPPSVKKKADSQTFLLAPSGNQAVVSLVRSLEGPQSIELELSMESYYGEQFSGTAVAKIYIFVTEFEF